MIYFCYFLFFFLIIRLLVSVVNYFSFHKLPEKNDLDSSKLVSILIPARNEELNIISLLKQIDSFSYPNFEVIVYDDNSTDNTRNLVAHFVEKNQKFKLVDGGDLEQGWLGKNYACHQLAKVAKGEYFLFLDADVKVKDGLIERSLGYFQKLDLHLLSIFPKQVFGSMGEKMSVPLMNWILLSLLPLVFIRNTRFSFFAAANGQFMLFKADTYKKQLPHKICRTEVVEDITIIKYFKTQGLKSDTILGNDLIKCRMYSSVSESIDGFAKNIFTFFGNSSVLTILFVGLLTLAPFSIFVTLGVKWGLVYLMGVVLIRVFVSLASEQSVIQNVLLILAQHVVLLLIVLKKLNSIGNQKLKWKGRVI